MKDNHHTIFSDTEKAFDKIQPYFIRKTQRSGYRGNITQQNKTRYEKPTASFILNNKKLKAFSLRSGIRKRCSLSPLIFSIVLKVLARATRQEKK